MMGSVEQSTLERAIESPIDYLGAVEVAPGRYAYRDDATRRYHVVAEASLETLGTDLVALDGHETHWTGVDGDPGTMAEAYSQWCGDTSSVEMPSWWSPGLANIPMYRIVDVRGNETDTARYDYKPKGLPLGFHAERITVNLETGEEEVMA